MTSGLPLRNDFDGFALRALAKGTKDAAQARRLLALAEIYDGHSRDAARIGGVTLQIVRDWVIRFNARGPSGLINGKAPGYQEAFRRASPGFGKDRRKWPDTGGAWRCALAAQGSCSMAVPRISIPTPDGVSLSLTIISSGSIEGRPISL
ncbi:helix-turn-helix domain-containing protein [Rhizobium laguerreae]|nr:helix-turn-helix domain-containing protein [Rhizobium laguerreae]MBY3356186.1 helix-turn-helix domain-containing protein [Rhizobium laguerreae]MBY3370162.1 helix-turn-helix domain-containing protein [Rhizobium laguerreae]MBY3377222.1 helix-turn-helix domain-containing protein [Rhizobium laguerreae]MBY3391052.1 helix-turn-helix domain-containing protein [Rhizobium laguerreae]